MREHQQPAYPGSNYLPLPGRFGKVPPAGAVHARGRPGPDLQAASSRPAFITDNSKKREMQQTLPQAMRNDFVKPVSYTTLNIAGAAEAAGEAGLPFPGPGAS